MKKVILLLVLAATMHATSFAQAGFKIGARLMPQSTWLLNKDDSNEGSELDYKSTWSFVGGLSTGYGFNDYLGAEVDFLYSGHSQKYVGKDGDTTFSAQTKLSYLKIPILFKVNTSPEATAMFSAFIGPQLYFLMGAKDNATMTESGVTTETKLDKTTVTTTSGANSRVWTIDKKPYSSFLFGLAFGFGTDFRLSDVLVLNSNIRLDYAFGDAEYKACKITSETDNGVSVIPYKDEYWKDLKSKYWKSSSSYTRVATSAITGGIQIGITYTFVQ